MTDREQLQQQFREYLDHLEKAPPPGRERELIAGLARVVISFWDVHPHSAMEMLWYAVERVGLESSHALGRLVVRGWQAKPGYSPDAGGNADHCYLSALLLSNNFDLAEQSWVQGILERNNWYSPDFFNYDRMKDGERRRPIVEEILRAYRSWPD